MNPYAVTFVLAAAIALALALVVRSTARRLGVLDRPDGFRKVHGRQVPLLGGVAIFGAFTISLFVCCWLTGHAGVQSCLSSSDFLSLVCGAAVVMLTGAWDDVRGLRARWKLLICTLVAVAMYFADYHIDSFSNPFGRAIYLGWFALPVTIFWFLGCMNAINLIDGMDGLAAGVVLFASAAVFMTSVLFQNASAALLSVALAGATLGFLVLNFHPASIFLGDSGSLLLGFLIASVGLRGAQKSHAVVALLIPVIALGLPIMDTALAMLRRWAKEIPFSAGDHQHIHHKLLEMGLSHRVAVLLMYAGCIVLAQLALLMSAANSLQATGLLVVLGLVTFLALRVVGRHELKLAKQRLLRHIERKRRSTLCRAAAYRASAKMRYAEAAADVWGVFSEAAAAMELDDASMVLFGDGPEGGQRGAIYNWERDGNGREDYNGHRSNGTNGREDDVRQDTYGPGHRDTDGQNGDILWSATLPLGTNGTELGKLSVSKSTNGAPLGPEVPDTLELLRKALAINLERVQISSLAAKA
jgi:UDP-GlcNAc:undecaprenyl-phosphate GlcNAc-1-phosphate transferase